MKKKIIVRLAAVFAAFGLILGTATAASAATSGNVVCLTSGSVAGSSVVAFGASGVSKVYITQGHCNMYYGSYNVQFFGVPFGYYCTSPWGYRYEGSNIPFDSNYYSFQTSGNRLDLDCRHA